MIQEGAVIRRQEQKLPSRGRLAVKSCYFIVVIKMQALKIGSSKGNEVARRLNACEDNILQKEMYRFQKEHNMVMKQFYNERYTVRQAMYDLRMSKERRVHKNHNIKAGGATGETVGKPVNCSETRNIRLDRRTSHRNNLCTQYNTQKNGTISPAQDCDYKTRNTRLRVRSLSVPNLSVRMTEAGQGVPRNSFDPRPGQFDLNANRVKVHSTATHGTIRKTCRWMRDTDEVDEDKNMKESVDGIIEQLGIDCSVQDKYEATIQQRQRSRSEATEIYQNNIPKQETQPLTVRAPVRPKTSQAIRRSSSRNTLRYPMKDECIDQEFVTLRNTEIKNRGLTRGGIRRVQNEVFTMSNISSSRPLSSPVAARFLCVSEAVLAAQKLIKSYRRQQAIEKTTEELQAKRKHSSSLMSAKKTRENEPVISNKVGEKQPRNRFKRATNLVMAANAFRRVATDEQKNKHCFTGVKKDGQAGQD